MKKGERKLNKESKKKKKIRKEKESIFWHFLQLLITQNANVNQRDSR